MDGAGLGTLTCLFSDIEGSTALELDLGTPAYRAILERHQALLRAAFGAHDGEEQSTEGDSFFVLFASPAAAIAPGVGQVATLGDVTLTEV